MKRTDVTMAVLGPKAQMIRPTIAQKAIDAVPRSEDTVHPMMGNEGARLTRTGEVRLTSTTAIKEPA